MRITKMSGTQSKGMGIGILDLLFPFLIPIKGMAWIGQKLIDLAENELTDKSKVQEELLNLQMLFEMDEISKEEYEQKEEEILERLEAIRIYEEDDT